MVSPADYPPPTPHDPPEEVFPGIFLVRGSYAATSWMRFNRNMTVVKHGDELTLINSVRLMPEAERQLEALGEIRHVMRLAYYHGMDDRYYCDRYAAEFWGPPGSRTRPGPAVTRQIVTGGELPFPDANPYVLAASRHPEVVILLEREGGILLTCDSLQYYTDYRFGSLVARIIMPLMGFPKGRIIVGPRWLKAMTPEGGNVLTDFEHIGALRFRHLIPGHGSVCRDDAQVQVQRAISHVWPEYREVQID